MNLKSRKIISIALVFFMMLTILPLAPVTAYAAAPAAPGNPHWDGYVAKWDVVSDADKYKFVLWRGNTSFGFLRKETNNIQYDVSAYMAPGQTYSFSVYAIKGEETSTDATSTTITVEGALGTISGITWNGYKLSWAPVADAVSYNVKLLKDNIQVTTKNAMGGTECDFTNEITANGAGEYYAEVEADYKLFGNTMASGTSGMLTVSVGGGETPHECSAADGWQYSETEHWKICKDDTCKKVIDETKEAHHGGTATCKAQAVCVDCGQSYGVYGEHDYGTKVEAQPAVHTPTELKAGMEAHYFCDVCDTYFTEEKVATTKTDLEIAAPVHEYNTVNGYKEADGHADTCSCGAHDTVVGHTPDIPAATEIQDQKCSVCGYVLNVATGHICKSHLTKVPANSASCTVDGNIEYYECSCGKYYTDSTAAVEITDKASVVIKAGHEYGTLIEEVPAKHTATELKAGMKAHYFCDVCDTYFTAEKVATTESELVIPAPVHEYNTVNGYKEADGHADTCSCGAHDTVVGHTPDIPAATETQDQKCSVCGYVINSALGHTHDYADEWSKDATYHWHAATCGHTNEVKDKDVHVYDTNKDATCNVCNYTRTVSSGSGSGGGFSGSYNYPVIVGDTDGADVAVSDEHATKGEEITVTVKPDAGEQVDEVIVTDKDGKVIPVTKTGDNEYTFTMPASKVTVDVVTEAADYGLRIVMQINNKNIQVNGVTKVNDVAPVIVADRTLVPIRVVTELLGGSAHWDNATRTVTLNIDGKVLSMTIGKEIPGFGTSAVIMNDRTYVPVRYVMEKLGADVEWINATRQIIIEK